MGGKGLASVPHMSAIGFHRAGQWAELMTSSLVEFQNFWAVATMTWLIIGTGLNPWPDWVYDMVATRDQVQNFGPLLPCHESCTLENFWTMGGIWRPMGWPLDSIGRPLDSLGQGKGSY
jgi:hypothetical protein